jgi:hypothetical protein
LYLQSGKASLGEELYKCLFAESSSSDEILGSLNLKFEHCALEVINRLEAAIFAWKLKVTDYDSGKSPVRTSWSFIKDSMSEMDKMELLLDRAEALLHHLKIRYPNLPHTFLNVTKIQYGKVSYLVFMFIFPIFSKHPSSTPFLLHFLLFIEIVRLPPYHIDFSAMILHAHI